MKGAAGAVAAAFLAASCGEGGLPGRDGAGEAGAPLIARADLFGEALRARAQLSPLGDKIAYLAPREGVLNVWTVPVETLDAARPVTDDHTAGVIGFVWAGDNETILYQIDARGNGDWRLYGVDARGGASRALTPANARAEILGVSPSDPEHVVVALNARDSAWPDVVRVNITTGAQELIYENRASSGAPGFVQFLVDHDNDLRLGVRRRGAQGADVLAFEGARAWRLLFTIPFEDALGSRPIAFGANGTSLLMVDSTGRDRAALVRVDMQSGVKTVLGESARADVADVWINPINHAPEAFGADYLRREWRAIEPQAQSDLDYLESQIEGEFDVVSRSGDNKRWIVVEESPARPARSYLYERATAQRRLTLLFRHRPALERAQLAPMTPIEIESRDGLTLVSYLTLPPGSDGNGDSRPDAPAPMVLALHGGPWGRDSYGFNIVHQWLANRGYAVLSVNHRGSSGFGKAFLNQSDRDWGARMGDDLIDAIDWAIDAGVADPKRIGVFGEGFGAFGALSALVRAPDRFACGAAYSPPADLTTMYDAIAPFDGAYRVDFSLRVGDPRTAEGRALLRGQSPLFSAGRISAPLLLAQGGRDARARDDADRIAEALRAKRGELVYLVFPEAGAELARTRDRLAFYAVADTFFADCLGGRAEAPGTAFAGARLIVYDGAARVAGLQAFARAPAARVAAPPARDDDRGPVALVPDVDLPVRTNRERRN